MTRVRAALYLDFDNVFGGLLKLDPLVAMRFAQDPGTWLERLAVEFSIDGTRRWLVLRCYLNPAGRVPHPKDPHKQLNFSDFRQHFTRAGFDVVDCPRLSATKNAADIRLVMDAMDALRGPTAYDEFVIASGDSDLTHLLVRLRAEDRRTTVISAAQVGEVFLAVADRFIDGEQLLGLVQGEETEPQESPSAPAGRVIARTHSAPADPATPEPVETTHKKAPDPRPAPVVRLSGALSLPNLERDRWPAIYAALAAVAISQEFSWTECTKWARDRLASQGTPVSRATVGLVTKGAAYGGCPLYRDPAPTAEEISQAFVNNTLTRTEAAELQLEDDEVSAIREWFSHRPHALD